MAKVTFEFDWIEESERVDTFLKSQEMSFAMHEIYHIVRGELKHGEEELSDHVDALFEKIKEISGEYV